MKKYDKEKVNVLSEKLSERITDVLDYFDIEYTEQDDLIYCPCPVHGGDKLDGFSIRESNVFPGQVVWSCWTHHCEKQYINSAIGLIRGILSNTKGDDVSFNEALKFGFDFVKISPEDIKINRPHQERAGFIKYANSILKNKESRPNGVSREFVRQSLKRPVQFYLNRGFKENTLDFFDVGICDNPSKPMFNRIVVPVYDDDNKHMAGCLGRSPEEHPTSHKWINSKGLNTGEFLYNYWNAKEHIAEYEGVVLVEGQGDVWRLYEAGVKNVVGMFGCGLSDCQRIILERSGALTIAILTDNDDAGIAAANKIKIQCERLFNIIIPTIHSYKDVGEMSIAEIDSVLKPQLQEIIK